MKRSGSVLWVLLWSVTAPLAMVAPTNGQYGGSEYDYRFDQYGRWIDHDYSYHSYGAYDYSDYDYNEYEYDGYSPGGANVSEVREPPLANAAAEPHAAEVEAADDYYEFGQPASNASVGSDSEYGYGEHNHDGYEDYRDALEAAQGLAVETNSAAPLPTDYSDYDCMYRETAWDESLHFIADNRDDPPVDLPPALDPVDPEFDNDAAYQQAVYGDDGSPADELAPRAASQTGPQTDADHESGETIAHESCGDEIAVAQPEPASIDADLALAEDLAVAEDVAADGVDLFEEFGDPRDIAAESDPVELMNQALEGCDRHGEPTDECSNPCNLRDQAEAASIWDSMGLFEFATQFLTDEADAQPRLREVIDPCFDHMNATWCVGRDANEHEPVLIHAAQALEQLGAALTSLGGHLREIAAGERISWESARTVR